MLRPRFVLRKIHFIFFRVPAEKKKTISRKKREHRSHTVISLRSVLFGYPYFFFSFHSSFALSQCTGMACIWCICVFDIYTLYMFHILGFVDLRLFYVFFSSLFLPLHSFFLSLSSSLSLFSFRSIHIVSLFNVSYSPA